MGKMGNLQWATGKEQWAIFNWQFLMGNLQWAICNRQNRQWKMSNGQFAKYQLTNQPITNQLINQ
jgi:hypothetical protein